MPVRPCNSRGAVRARAGAFNYRPWEGGNRPRRPHAAGGMCAPRRCERPPVCEPRGRAARLTPHAVPAATPDRSETRVGASRCHRAMTRPAGSAGTWRVCVQLTGQAGAFIRDRRDNGGRSGWPRHRDQLGHQHGSSLAAQRCSLTGERLIQLALARALEDPGNLGEQIAAAGPPARRAPPPRRLPRPRSARATAPGGVPRHGSRRSGDGQLPGAYRSCVPVSLMYWSRYPPRWRSGRKRHSPDGPDRIRLFMACFP